MATTPEERYARWRTTAVIVWAVIGVLVLLAVAFWALGKIVARARAVRHGVRHRVPAQLAGRARSRARGMTRGLRARRCASWSASRCSAVLVTLLGPPSRSQIVSFAARVPRATSRRSSSCRERDRDAATRRSCFRRGWRGARRPRRSRSAAPVRGRGRQRARADRRERGRRRRDRLLRHLPRARHRVLGAQGPAQDPRARSSLLAGPDVRGDAEHLHRARSRAWSAATCGADDRVADDGDARDDRARDLRRAVRARARASSRSSSTSCPTSGRSSTGLIAGLVGLFVGPWTALARGRASSSSRRTSPTTLVTPRVMSDAGRPASDPRDILAARRRHAVRDPGHAVRHPRRGHRQGAVRLLLRAAHASASSPARTARCSATASAAIRTRARRPTPRRADGRRPS